MIVVLSRRVCGSPPQDAGLSTHCAVASAQRCGSNQNFGPHGRGIEITGLKKRPFGMLYLIPPWLRQEFELQIECKPSFFEVKEPNSSCIPDAEFHSAALAVNVPN